MADSRQGQRTGADAIPPQAVQTEEALLARINRITGGHGRLKERFFDGAALSQQEQGRYPVHHPHNHNQQRPFLVRRESASSALDDEGSIAVDGADTSPTRSTQCVYHVVDGRRVAKELRQPFRHYGAQADAHAAQPLARWPSDMEMISPPPRHIYYVPKKRSPFAPRDPSTQVATYFRRGAVTKRTGRVVYQRDPPDSVWFLKDRVATYKSNAARVEPQYTPTGPADSTLVFESRFESGNLCKALQVGEFEYNLYLQTDRYTERHTQWFYFRVGNTRRGQAYKLQIVNLLKGDSLYNHGMQPVVYSETNANDKSLGWVRKGTAVSYFRNDIRSHDTGRYQHTLSWTYTAEHDGDTVYFAHCFPYTYTNLQDYLTALAEDPKRKQHVRRRVLCRTLAGNSCDLLTITRFGVSDAVMASRRGIVLTARIHPGETNASWMMKGFLDFLTSASPDAEVLREHFVFKVVPMLNPDGVIVGNYRCSLAGADLNRAFKNTAKEVFPTIHAAKLMMQRFARDRPIVVYCDLHGHSRKHNVFVYGCDNKHDPQKRMLERVFPRMLQLNGPDVFSYKHSKFSVRKGKEATGRVATWRELNLVNAFTMEATFCGSTIGELRHQQFTCADFESLGPIFCDALLDYCDPNGANAELILTDLRLSVLNKYLLSVPAYALDNPADDSDVESESDGSDSSASDGAVEAAQVRFELGASVRDDMAVVEAVRSKIRARRAASARAATARTTARGKKGKKLRRRASQQSLGGGASDDGGLADGEDGDAAEGSRTGRDVPGAASLRAGSGAGSAADPVQRGKAATQRGRERATSASTRATTAQSRHTPASASSAGPFKSKYDNVAGNGIPSFSEQQIEERKMRKAAKEEKLRSAEAARRRARMARSSQPIVLTRNGEALDVEHTAQSERPLAAHHQRRTKTIIDLNAQLGGFQPSSCSDCDDEPSPRSQRWRRQQQQPRSLYDSLAVEQPPERLTNTPNELAIRRRNSRLGLEPTEEPSPSLLDATMHLLNRKGSGTLPAYSKGRRASTQSAAPRLAGTLPFSTPERGKPVSQASSQVSTGSSWRR